MKVKTVILAMLSVLAASCAPEGTPDVRVSVTQAQGPEARVVFEWRSAQRRATFNAVSGDYREGGWILPPEFALAVEDGLDIVARRDGRRFKSLEITVRPAKGRLEKEYQPLAPYGAGGVLLYTGHIWPVRAGGERTDAAFDFIPAPGGSAVAFGERAEEMRNWRSPENHPAFIYLGPIEPIETENVMAIVDPAVPRWIVRLFDQIVPESFEALSEMFGFSPAAKPNLFLTAITDGEDGRLSYGGDALPGQFQISLEGGAWKTPSDRAREIFVFSTIHEAVHLWQAAVRPEPETPEWIHEGAADAIAAETMVELGLWDSEQLQAAAGAARRECAATLNDGALNTAKERGAYRALYSCGWTIALAAAKADGAGTADFWRDLINRGQAAGGYNEAMFYEVAEKRSASPEFAAALREFARTPLADPKRDIDALFAEAGALAREARR